MAQKIQIVTDKTRVVQVGGESKITTIKKNHTIKINGVGVQGAGIPEAPIDGNQYARKDAGWEVVDAGGDVDSVNGKTGVVVINPDDLDDSATTNKFVTSSQITVIDNQSGVNTGDQDISGIGDNSSRLDQIDLDQITQNNAIALNTSKRTYPLADENRLANTSGTNTGDQDISGIGDNTSAITTINETAIFIDPLSPQDVQLNWKGNNIEYDALTPIDSTIYFINQLQTLLTATVTGDQDVVAGDSEIYSATYTGTADDVTYLWTVTGSAFANISGSDTGQTVTVDYTQGVAIESVSIKCVISSSNAQDSVEDTLPVELTPSGFVAYTQSFRITDTVADVGYGVAPVVQSWKDYGTSGTDLTQTNPSNQPSVVTGSPNGLQFGTDDFMDGIIPPSPLTKDWSFVFKLNWTVSGSAQVLISQTNSANSNILIRGTGNFAIFNSVGTVFDFVYNPVSGQQSIAVFREGLTASLYVNGVFEETIAISGSFNFLRVGRVSFGINSPLQELNILDRALTSAEAIAETT